MVSKFKIAGTLYGQAIGDVIARQTEFLPLKTIIETYGTTGGMPFPDVPTVTDDTSMMLAVASALPQTRNRTARGYVGALLAAFLDWNEDPDNRDCSVLSNAVALDRLKTLRTHKRSWTEGTALNSASVALTRATPVAFIDGKDAAGVAQLQTALTHADPSALAASELFVLSLRLLIDDNDTDQVLRRLISSVRGKCSQENLYLDEWLGKLENVWPESGHASMYTAWLRMRDLLLAVERLLEDKRIYRDVCAVLGNGFSADTAFGCGLYFFLRYGDNPMTAVSEAARTSGDSTAITAVTGALCGAESGKAAWPEQWMHSVNVRERIEKAVNGLYAIRVAS